MSSSVLCGQAALVGLPTGRQKNVRTLQSLEIPSALKVDRKRLKTEGGVSVYKVTKVSHLFLDTTTMLGFGPLVFSRDHLYHHNPRLANCNLAAWPFRPTIVVYTSPPTVSR